MELKILIKNTSYLLSTKVVKFFVGIIRSTGGYYGREETTHIELALNPMDTLSRVTEILETGSEEDKAEEEPQRGEATRCTC